MCSFPNFGGPRSSSKSNAILLAPCCDLCLQFGVGPQGNSLFNRASCQGLPEPRLQGCCTLPLYQKFSFADLDAEKLMLLRVHYEALACFIAFIAPYGAAKTVYAALKLCYFHSEHAWKYDVLAWWYEATCDAFLSTDVSNQGWQILKILNGVWKMYAIDKVCMPFVNCIAQGLLILDVHLRCSRCTIKLIYWIRSYKEKLCQNLSASVLFL